jgi:hypothetical protein
LHIHNQKSYHSKTSLQLFGLVNSSRCRRCGEKGLATENRQNSETTPKNAANPSRPAGSAPAPFAGVHPGMMAGDHFLQEDVLLSTQGEIKKLSF